MILFLLLLSILLSTGRNLLSKRLSDISFGSARFFLCQSLLFLFGGVDFRRAAWQTWLYALIYGTLLICAQWFYTASLSAGKTALCSTVYSMGFILPTLSGSVFWEEHFSELDFLGVLCAVAAIILSGVPSTGQKRGEKSSNRYFLPLLVAMLASGGLGIVQKSQQKSDFADQRALFLLIAFALASGLSLLAALLSRRKTSVASATATFPIAACVGLFFGCCNLLNTVLAGKMDSAIFFPTLNIGVILLTLLCGVLLFREKIRKKELLVMLSGIASIFLLNLG